MADTTSNPQNGFDWEDACLDPHHASLHEGKAEGREAGAIAGFQEGQNLGHGKGLEFGMEVGFYQGVVKSLQESGRDFNERTRKSIQKLQEAIDRFPLPDEVFSQTRSTEGSVLELGDAPGQDGTAQEEANDSEGYPSRFDIINRLQGIRARFKLLAAQLGKPQFSLRSALEDPSADNKESPPSELVDQDW